MLVAATRPVVVASPVAVGVADAVARVELPVLVTAVLLSVTSDMVSVRLAAVDKPVADDIVPARDAVGGAMATELLTAAQY